jgi:hypothetical protein
LVDKKKFQNRMGEGSIGIGERSRGEKKWSGSRKRAEAGRGRRGRREIVKHLKRKKNLKEFLKNYLS